MSSGTVGNVGNNLMSFMQQVGMQDELVTDNHQSVSG